VTFYEEMAETARELIGPGSEFGEALTFERPAGGYDAATRKKTAGAGLSQPASGTFDSDLTPVSLSASLAATHERVVTAVPDGAVVFDPGQNDRCIGDGQTWIVMETAHVRKQGVLLLWVCGLKSA
jgi:hypothetical protein